MKEILINKQEKVKQILLLEEGNLIEKYIENEDVQRIEGNIYIGKVVNVLQGMQAAFVNIGQKKNTFIHLKDILPKVDITKEELDDTKKIKEVIKVGMPLLIQQRFLLILVLIADS